MFKKMLVLTSIFLSIFLSGCASVPMASMEEDNARKEFSAPPPDQAGLYVYRNTTLGGALKKTVRIDGEIIGETAPMTYFYKSISAGSHTLSTESEFSDNALTIDVVGGKNYFVRQYMKIGAFVGGANLELVSEEEGKKGVLECELAK